MLLVHQATSQYDPVLHYQDRDDRYEGIRPEAKSGRDLELISVRVDYREDTKGMPQRLKLKFFLPETRDVYLTVRELEYDHYYWMDKVKPHAPWRAGFYNLFEWSTTDVLQRLTGLEVYELGVVAILGTEEQTGQDRIAPVILYHRNPPRRIGAYLFTAKTNTPATLTCSVYPAGEPSAIYRQTLRRVRAGKPFTCRWNAASAVEGGYRLVVDGYSLQTNDPITQVIDFYHKPDAR
jgi:hypothetical protein